MEIYVLDIKEPNLGDQLICYKEILNNKATVGFIQVKQNRKQEEAHYSEEEQTRKGIASKNWSVEFFFCFSNIKVCNSYVKLV